MNLVLEGFLNTVALTLLSFAGASLAGLLVAVLRIVPVPLLRGIGAVYVEVWRNVPLLAWLVLFVFGLPEVGVRMSLFWTACTAIALYEAAFVAEALRSGCTRSRPGRERPHGRWDFRSGSRCGT